MPTKKTFNKSVKVPNEGHSASFSVRGDLFNQMLVEDFRFMEAVRVQSRQHKETLLSTNDLKTVNRIKELMIENPQGLINFAPYSQQPVQMKIQTSRESIIATDYRTRRFITRMSRFPPLDIWAHWLLKTRIFSAIMIMVIVLSSFLILLEEEIPDKIENRNFRVAIDALDFIFLMMFVMEIVLKWIDDLWGFWDDPWNWFDFVVTTLSLVAPLFDLIYQNSDDDDRVGNILQIVVYIRIIRILRSLNVVTRIRKIQIIWVAITRTFTSLFFITLLMLIFFYIFAIIGIQIFDRFTKSHRNDLLYHQAFRDLPMAMFTLFQIFTLDHWYDILITISHAMPLWIPCTYVLVWVLLGSLIFKNIFVGVMVNNFQNIREELAAQGIEASEKAKLSAEHNVLGLEKINQKEDEENDPLVGWEATVFHHLEVIRAAGTETSPTLWPRDTLFQFLIILEALANNLEERDRILKLLNQALLRHYDP